MGRQLKGVMGNRHLSGWDNIETSKKAGEKISKKLRRNAESLDEEEENEAEDKFSETADFFERDE